jgi:hypothetical protein
MSTLPLTPIEGFIALPRLRPLDHLPISFGRDWTLRPPEHSWRAQLKALYAAVLHTICLSNQAILSFCKWEPLDTRRATAVVSQTMATHSISPRASHVDSARMPAQMPVLSMTSEADVAEVSRSASTAGIARAGGVCALSGIAILAWLALNQPVLHHTIDDEQSTPTPIINRDSEPTERSSIDALATRKPTANGKLDAQTQSTPSARVINPRASMPPSASTAATEPARLSNDAMPAHRHSTPRETTRSPHDQTRRNNTRVVEKIQWHQVAALRSAMSSAVASRGSAAPSSAGAYSPFNPAELAGDEYTSITMSAATTLRDTATHARSVTSGNPSEAGDTQWMSRLSQRRVTDVPEQFSK